MTTLDHSRTGVTHEVTNQPPPFEDQNLLELDLALQEGLVREEGDWGVDRARDLGAVAATATASTRSSWTRRGTGSSASASSARSRRSRGAASRRVRTSSAARCSCSGRRSRRA